MEELHRKKYTVVRVKNTFKEGAVYKGVNTLVKDPHGNIFELQFHTPQSVAIKENELHKLYEKQRMLDKKSDRRKWDELEEKMKTISDTIVIPTGIERID